MNLESPIQLHPALPAGAFYFEATPTDALGELMRSYLKYIPRLFLAHRRGRAALKLRKLLKRHAKIRR